MQVLATLALTSPLFASATEDGRWYGGFGLGWNYANPMKLDAVDGRIEFDFGLPAASLAVGRHTFEHWRFELEAWTQVNEPEVLYFTDSDLEFDTLENDRFAATSILVNAYRDFEWGIAFQPHFGIGVGPSKVSMRFTDIDAEEDEPPLIDDSAWTFAYQLTAGVTVPLAKRLDLDLDYRFWQASSLNLEDTVGNSINSAQSTHSGWVRLRYYPGDSGNFAERLPPHPVPAPRGFYFAGSIGGGWPVDLEFDGSDQMLDAFAVGPMGSVAVGYHLGRRWRLELEAATRKNDMDVVDFGTIEGERRSTGSVRGDSLALNAAYRFRPDTAINPVIGAGIGVARTRFAIDFASEDDGGPYLSDTATSLLFQWMVGFDIALTRRWSVLTDYRMWIANDMTVELADGESVSGRHVVHSMSMGVRYSLDP